MTGAPAWEPARAWPPSLPPAALALTVPQAVGECGVSVPPPVQVDAVAEQDDGAARCQGRQETDAKTDAGHQAAQRALGTGQPRVSKPRVPNPGFGNSEPSTA